MKVLWITNIEFPEVVRQITGNGELKSTGGWLVGAAEAITNYCDNIELYVATVSHLVEKLTQIQGEKIKYYLLPWGKGNLKKNNEYIPLWQQVKQEVKPDIIHIHGTEFSHGLAYVDACGANNVVVSIQGLKSAYYYYYYGLSKWDILKNSTLRDLIKGTPIREKLKFKIQSKYEVELLQKVMHIIGRTSWDRARTWAINPQAEYHFCNETLRREFYDGSKWTYDNCNKHSIFVSQAGYPIKGLHQLLKAMPLILREYPDTEIHIAGNDITKCNRISDLKSFTTYGKIISKLIKQLGLLGRITFTGNLNAEEMKVEYLKCNVFVCPSSVENSPNSLGEAQILGTPVVASYVGGVPDMMSGDDTNLYRFEEIEMLAYKICETFHKSSTISNKLANTALARHNAISNTETLIEIYKKIRSK